jgi:hypothetical protein
MLQGFINFLTGTSREATELRNRINFFIVPMANPDGVICGNSRTSLAGKDLNRQFTLASKDLYPEVAAVKELARKIQASYGLLMYLDFHGHSRKKNTFFYGPSFPIHEPNYYKSRIFPKLVEKVDSNFRFYSCTFTL